MRTQVVRRSHLAKPRRRLSESVPLISSWPAKLPASDSSFLHLPFFFFSERRISVEPVRIPIKWCGIAVPGPGLTTMCMNMEHIQVYRHHARIPGGERQLAQSVTWCPTRHIMTACGDASRQGAFLSPCRSIMFFIPAESSASATFSIYISGFSAFFRRRVWSC